MFFLFVTLARDNRSLNPFAIHACAHPAGLLICYHMQMKVLLFVSFNKHEQIHVQLPVDGCISRQVPR